MGGSYKAAFAACLVAFAILAPARARADDFLDEVVGPDLFQLLPASTKADKPADDKAKDKEKDKSKEKDKPAEDKAKSSPDKAEDKVGWLDHGIKGLFDSVHVPSKRKWYEKLSWRGYTQFRFGRTVERNDVTPQLLGDSNINGRTEDFSLRRVRLILFGDVGDHLGIYIQPDFAVTPEGSVRNTFFTQLRDCYGDVFLTTDKVHRVRVGLSKVPWGFQNMQSSQNRVPLDRDEALNSAVQNERDLGLFYYWTPEEQQHIFRDLVDGGLKGSGNYGVFAFGVYNGQGGSQFDQNRNLHQVMRLTYPFVLPGGQVIETSIQGYRGEYVVEGAAIRPLGRPASATSPTLVPRGTRTTGDVRGNKGLTDQRLAGSLIVYPQPLGFQCEWQVGEGPGLSDDQRQVDVRALSGGYVMVLYKYDTFGHGVYTPFLRYQNYYGGIKSQANAPFGRYEITDLGVECRLWREVELTAEYAHVSRVNTTAQSTGLSYRKFNGDVFRIQIQLNY